MEKFFTVAQVIAPIFAALLMGVLARRKALLTQENVRGLQQFAVQFGLPCVVFNACLRANMGVESVSSMALVAPLMLLSTLWAFRARRKLLPYHNLPMLFSAQESGMLGIPLFIILFGAEQSYRVGVLDLTQAIIAYPTIAILTADVGEELDVWGIVKKVISSPLLIMSLLGLMLNLTGVVNWMDNIGITPVITESTAFLAQPVSAVMIFCVGYNFSMDSRFRKAIFRISGLHLVIFSVFCLVMQAALYLVPNVDALTRWALLLYCFMPASYLAPGLGRTEEDATVASGVCSLLTVVCIAVFCVMAAIVA